MPLPTYQIPEGFLSGGSIAQFQWTKSKIFNDLSSEEWTCISHFLWRASEFLENVEDACSESVQSLSLDLHHVLSGKVNKGSAKSNTWPGRYRVKSIVLDFRPLMLKNSLGNLKRTRGVVHRHTNNDVLKEFITKIKKQFLRDRIEFSADDRFPLEQREISVDKLIDLWFNTFYFHDGNLDQIHRVRDIHTFFEGIGVEHILYFHLVSAAHYVRCLYAVLQNAQPSSPYFNVPHTQYV